MTRHLPPFPAIRAFEAAARHMSFREAAGELCVTPSAISHQVRTLEEYLGREVFVREGNRLGLTEAGQDYLAELTPILDRLVRASEAAAAGPARPFRIIVSPSFGLRWLMPRIDRCPLKGNLHVTHAAGPPDTDFSRNGADLVVQWLHEPVPGARVEPLMRSGRYPAASPEVAARIRRPRDLLAEPLMRDDVYDGWEAWFALAGIGDTGKLRSGGVLSSCEMIMSAAERGQGVALVFDAMARDTLRRGTLVRLFRIATPPMVLYSVAVEEARAEEPAIRRFRDWLFEEVRSEGTGVERPLEAAAV